MAATNSRGTKMKHTKICLAIGLSSVLMLGCGSSDDDKPTEPPVEPPVTTIDINDTQSISAVLQSVDGEKGSVTLTLTGDDDKQVTSASAFNLVIMGYPEEGQASTKYKLAWHQANHSNCITDEQCTLNTHEAEPGVYNLDLEEVEWKVAVSNYRVAVEVMGDKAHLELAFLD